MASTDFTLETNQEILKWLFGKTTLAQPTLPLQCRWMSADNGTSLTPGTEVSAGAASRVNVTYNTAATYQYSDGFASANSQNSGNGSLVWPGGTETIQGTEIWDSSATPRRICYDKANSGYTVTTGDLLEWTAPNTGVALQMMGFDATIVGQALNWAMGRSTGWTRPQGPFKIKLVQYDDLTYYANGDFNNPKVSLKSILANSPMQTITFGNVTSNSDHQAVIRSDIGVTFPSFSSDVSVFVQGYEIWDSSSTPRKLLERKQGQDYVRDRSSSTFIVVPPNNTLTIPLGTLKISLGRGDGSGV